MSAKPRNHGRPANPAVARPARPPSPPPPAFAPAAPGGRVAVFGVCLLLAAITLAVFGQTRRFDFINSDDGLYVYENAAVNQGLTARGFAAAFSYHNTDNWVPLTTISHMLDCQLFGLRAGGHHLVNVVLHLASAMLLFLVLRQMTRTLWRSAFVAAVFAVHPLHVESVAWVAERKDVLSGLFFMLALWAYARRVRRPGSAADYWALALFFALGLMSKPMLVTLPVLLLLLDYWPLERFSSAPSSAAASGRKDFSLLKRLVAEKIPLLALSTAAVIVTVAAQVQANTVQSLREFPASWRIENALVSCVMYIWQTVWPARLAPFYPYPAGGWPLWEIAGAFAVLAALSLAAFRWRRSHPYFLAGWLWYLVAWIPVSGFLQAGAQARADRYTYLPQIGLSWIVAWSAVELSAGWRHRRWILGGLAAAVVGALLFAARLQASYWQNSVTIWTHTLAVTTQNAFAENDLGNALLDRGQTAQGILHLRKALEIRPDFADAYNNLGNALAENGRLDEAIADFQKALTLRPGFAQAHDNLGLALLQENRGDEAMVHWRAALAIWPDFAEAHYGLGTALLQKGLVDDAIAQFQLALAINPNQPEALDNLGYAWLQKGKVDDAINDFQQALKIAPDSFVTLNNLGTALLEKGQPDPATVPLRKALEIHPDSADAHNNLGEALLRLGRTDEAISQFQTALQINPSHAGAHGNLGHALSKEGRLDEAASHYRAALALQPGNDKFQNGLANVAWLLATAPDPSARNGTRAVELAELADHASAGQNPVPATALAAAYAEAGRFPEAVATAQRALQLATAQGEPSLAARVQAELKSYQAGAPFREAGTNR